MRARRLPPGADEGPEGRDRAADARDRAADERDRAAALRDATAAKREGSESPAAHERRAAAHDRATAAHDRDQARRDRAAAARDRRSAGLDPLTGVLRRETGLLEVERELERVRRLGEEVVVAFVDVDGLKAVNDRYGHAAGDRLLRTVARALGEVVRSYDVVARYGGDEFLCALSGADLATARDRFDDVNTRLARAEPPASVTVGLALAVPDDTVESVVARADEDLYRSRRGQAAS